MSAVDPRVEERKSELNKAFRSLREGRECDVPEVFQVNDPGIRTEEFVAKVSTAVTQAQVLEDDLAAFEAKDWRKHFSLMLSGHGLEIGPLHRPMIRHENMTVDYIDRYKVKDLREHYPELGELLLVEPHIIGDAQMLDSVEDGSYDFVIAAHVIEHMKNPLSAIEHWVRVLKPGGRLYLIAPDKRMIFDRDRVRTTVEHMILDYQSPSDARDFEHFLDYATHVHEKRGMDAIEEARRLAKEDYSIHFHTFIPSDMKKLLLWFGENITSVDILEGPVTAPGSDEFHFLIEKSKKN